MLSIISNVFHKQFATMTITMKAKKKEAEKDEKKKDS